jgi:chorismate-pyruvate lyase
MMVSMDRVGAGPRRGRAGRGLGRPSADLLIEALAGMQGTVTEFLESVAKEPVFAEKLDQVETTATRRTCLAVEVGHPLIRRVTILRGQRSLRRYLYADTVIVTDRLPVETWERLQQSSDPIGRVLLEHDLTTQRVDLPRRRSDDTGRRSGITDGFIYGRRYRLDIGPEPVMEISEWFLPDLEDCLVG